MKLESNGITAELPPGWEAEIMVRPESEAEVVRAGGEQTTKPVAHMANFPLPPDRGDFGSNAVEVMAAEDLLVCLIEYDNASASSELFSSEGLPTLSPDQFSPESMQRSLPGQSGTQEFFNIGGRAFCIYVVLGSHARRQATIDRINQVIAGIEIEPVD